jgi:hypothetical protein
LLRSDDADARPGARETRRAGCIGCSKIFNEANQGDIPIPFADGDLSRWINGG